MLELSTEFWIQIMMFVFAAGTVWQKLKHIEKKQDKHNKLIERMYNAEKNINTAHNRIDNLEEKVGGD